MQIGGVTVQNYASGLWIATSIKTTIVCRISDLPHMGFEYELCQAAIINMTNKVLWVLTTGPFFGAIKWITKDIFLKIRWLLFLINTLDFPGLGLRGWTYQICRIFIKEASKVIDKRDWKLISAGWLLLVMSSYKLKFIYSRISSFFTQLQLKMCNFSDILANKNVSIREFGRNEVCRG